MRTIKFKKIISIALASCMTLSVFALSASAAGQVTNEVTLKEIADSVITKADQIDTLDLFEDEENNNQNIYYDNINGFISEAKKETSVTNDELGKFILTYTGLWNKKDVGSCPEQAKQDALEYKNVASSITYYKVSEDGTQEAVSSSEIETVMPYADADGDWGSDDGYMAIRTSAMEGGTAGESGKGKLFYVITEQHWFKRPLLFFTDVLAVNTTATYDDTYFDWAQYETAANISDDQRIFHGVYLDKENQTSDGCRTFYPAETISGMAFEIKTLDIKNPNPNGFVFNWGSESRMGIRVIVDPNKSANIKSGYCHKTIGFGDISVSLSNGGISFGISGVGTKKDYLPPPITVFNY